MGLVKQAWIEHQEMEPMLEWIEDNYGDIDEENTEEWDEAVCAYENHVREAQRRDEEAYEEAELEWYLHTKSPIGIFNKNEQTIRELLSLIDTNISYGSRFNLLVMLHAHTVASLEAYLASTFIQKVTGSDELIKKLIESDPVFSKMKFTLQEIYEKHDNLKLTVSKYLKDLIFHEIRKVKPLFLSVLDCNFGDVTWLFEAVSTRHHCVHRAGLDKDGNMISIDQDSLSILLGQSAALVALIEDNLFQLEEIPF